MTKLQFYLSKLASQLWVRPTILSLAAIGWVALSFFSDRFLPEAAKINITKETLINLFTILASTMLTVATFSVSAVATAFSSVATSATPRATSIVMSDAGVQGTLAAFLASFIYAVVSITALSALDFGGPGRFMLFLGFVLLVGWVLMSFLRWVDRVSRLGKLGDTLQRVAEAAQKAFANSEIVGLFGGRPHEDGKRPEDALVLRFDQFGYVQHLDMEELQEIAREIDGEIWLDVRPGTLVTANAPVGVIRCAGKPDEKKLTKVLRCLSVGSDRNYGTDPRFSMILLAEVADRALSPAVNDPGTAIAVLSIQLELFYTWAKHIPQGTGAKSVKFDRVFVPGITAQDLIFDAFTPIARDGAGMIEVCIRLHKALRALMHIENKELQKAAEEYRELALELSDQGLPVESQKKIVQEFAHRPL